MSTSETPPTKGPGQYIRESGKGVARGVGVSVGKAIGAAVIAFLLGTGVGALGNEITSDDDDQDDRPETSQGVDD